MPLCLKVCKLGCGSIEAPSRGEPKPGPLGPDFYLCPEIVFTLSGAAHIILYHKIQVHGKIKAVVIINPS